MSVEWLTEGPKIRKAAALGAVDAPFIMAIRQVENGGPGREFGVLSVKAPSYDQQLETAVRTVGHRLALYPGNPLVRNQFNRVVYSDKWIQYFASVWAPTDASNDPDNLNANWASNAIVAYKNHVANERSALTSSGLTSVGV